ncbi:DUF1573 domain-containing protein [Halpernia frigidisoli]|uniref:DUF1573 domain-containing protein n=1 Tax=Halpernia frigidisoli TaxID=1125876 RepID=A0A1I3FPQ1_9FLAO|nr:DUF1573 domain-containing protein [Halpernia frigidisoli]SFI13160.1 Protein of unknown function [Halpernia frigidisoli]
MKNILAGLFLTASFAVASAQTISFNETTHDYGTIAKGANGQTFFTVTNTGDKPLIISKVQPSCGCTTPKWDSNPIMPGKTSKIDVGYNTQLVNPFQKMIEVYSNDPKNSRSVLYIKGTVTPEATMSATASTSVELMPAKKQMTALKAQTKVKN